MKTERETVITLDVGDNVVVRVGNRDVNIVAYPHADDEKLTIMNITTKDTLDFDFGVHDDGRVTPDENEGITSFNVI